jgi:nicotinate-nucleotide--dimethylbenzimidazole phosphoribosyltransferase
MEKKFKEIIKAVRPVEGGLEAEARVRLDSLTKPPGSLGMLEDMAAAVYCVQESYPLAADPARVYVAAADHGVVEEGVSLFPSEVTRQMVANFLSGGAAINVLSRTVGAQLTVVDVGAAGEPFPESEGLLSRRVRPGTANMATGPAMSREECLQALAVGVELAETAKKDGLRTVILGEMGIGNTTAAAALYCALLGLSPAEAAGPGTGLGADGVARKAAVLERALEANRKALESKDPLAILAAVGGLEIACLAGLAIGAARHGLLVLVDGYIATAALVSALALCPAADGYCFTCHASAEPGHAKALKRMGRQGLLDLGLRLGEGTGAALALHLLRSAVAVFNDMATFESAGVSRTPE